jgi:hypothetical protein
VTYAIRRTDPKTGRSWLLTSRYEDRRALEAMLAEDPKALASSSYLYSIEEVFC